ncbi:hypothetical protein EF903_05445 [Streptomyces sp. WAC05292]|uniref:hypothetical protein n=1 Tax=Streptomyces sp. WAC05292 TaxID=2487418 RepID=UPI000F7400B5|nr:hypothetical protein [Streptomyces sp. WAC05292]RSS95085.1 hypothetical protein EF903_05445 [Streptomyces sp. WAC05292]
MQLPPFPISSRFDSHRHPDGLGDQWSEHMRLLGDRLFYFQHGSTVEGWSTVRAYERVPGAFVAVPGTDHEPGMGPAWRLIHEWSLLP